MVIRVYSYFQRLFKWTFNHMSSNTAEKTKQILPKAKLEFDKKWLEEKHSLAKLSDYQLIRTIGKGKFGRVMLARLLKKPRLFAIKILRKTNIIRLEQIRHVTEEKRVLQSIDYPFLVKYFAHFKNNGYLFIVLEFVNGGDLFTLLKRMNRLNGYECRFFAAQVVLSFEYLHYLGVIFRDLKPENILVDRQGYIKITDFGFAKKIDDTTTTTLCGTPEYFAPEIIHQVPYSYPLDWWTLGILIFEMLRGYTPFRHNDHLKMFQKIQDGKVNYPSYFKNDTIDLVNRLLKVNVQDRLSTADELKEHVYFKKMDWNALLYKQLTAPYVPRVDRESDVSNFDDNIPEEELEDYQDNLYTEEFKDF